MTEAALSIKDDISLKKAKTRFAIGIVGLFAALIVLNTAYAASLEEWSDFTERSIALKEPVCMITQCGDHIRMFWGDCGARNNRGESFVSKDLRLPKKEKIGHPEPFVPEGGMDLTSGGGCSSDGRFIYYKDNRYYYDRIEKKLFSYFPEGRAYLKNSVLAISPSRKYIVYEGPARLDTISLGAGTAKAVHIDDILRIMNEKKGSFSSIINVWTPEDKAIWFQQRQQTISIINLETIQKEESFKVKNNKEKYYWALSSGHPDIYFLGLDSDEFRIVDVSGNKPVLKKLFKNIKLISTAPNGVSFLFRSETAGNSINLMDARGNIKLLRSGNIISMSPIGMDSEAIAYVSAVGKEKTVYRLHVLEPKKRDSKYRAQVLQQQ